MDSYTVTPAQSGRSEMDQALPPSPDIGAVDILQAIQVSHSTLETQIGGVQTDVSLIRQDLHNVVDRVTEAEGRISELEDTVRELRSTVSQLTASTGGLETRAEDAENYAPAITFALCDFSRGRRGPPLNLFWSVGASHGFPPRTYPLALSSKGRTDPWPSAPQWWLLPGP